MATGLQGYVGRSFGGGVAQRLGVAQRHDFSVRATGLLGAALAYHLATRAHQHATYARVGVGPQQRGVCLLQRLRQVGLRGVPVCGGGLGGRHGQGQQPVVEAVADDDVCCAAWFSAMVRQSVSPVCVPMAAA